MRRSLVLGVVAVLGAALLGPAAQSGAATTTAALYVVALRPGTDGRAVALSVGARPSHVFRHVLSGFSARLTPDQVAALRSNAIVDSVEPDVTFHVQAQFIQVADKRIGAVLSPTAHIDGVDQRVNADIAIIDTGIDRTHPDLNVVGGIDCKTPGKPHRDLNGHGTMVAGFAAALDNGLGVVGVAPGARLWDVRVLGRNGVGSTSKVICGLDWVKAHAGTIDVANMSLGGRADNADDGQCGRTRRGREAAFHQAICAVVGAGVTITAAAGNDNMDAANYSPAGYREVLTVSAFTETDGIPGGLGPVSTGCEPGEHDDHLALFSNFGHDVDISAPGVCVTSTYPGNRYASGSGTSFSTPFVTGAVALYRATHPTATPAQVKAALLAAAEPGPIAGDPDAFPEPVLNVSSF